MAAEQGCTVLDLIQKAEQRKRIDIRRYVSDAVGLPTLTDIMAELAKPGRDPRKDFEVFAFAGHVAEIKDLQPGMQLPGIVTNVTKFGAFVDVGVHQDGLVHVSQLADRFIKDPADVVKVQQKVTVTVLEVDLARKRISLSMRSGAKAPPAEKTAAPSKTRPERKSGAPSRPQGRNPQNRGKQPFHNPLAEALGQWRGK
jgi:uncharacterized protein